MADKDIEIRIKRTADTAGAKQMEQALSRRTDSDRSKLIRKASRISATP